MDSAPPRPSLPHCPCHPPPTAPPHLRTPQIAALSGESTACAPGDLSSASLGGGGLDTVKVDNTFEKQESSSPVAEFSHYSLICGVVSIVQSRRATLVSLGESECVCLCVQVHSCSLIFTYSLLLPHICRLSVDPKLVLRAGFPKRAILAILLPFLLSRSHTSQTPLNHHFGVEC